MTPFMAPHLFALMLIIRAERGQGSTPVMPGKEKLSRLGEGFFHQRRLLKEEKKKKKKPAALRWAVSVSRTKYVSPQVLIQKWKVTSPSGRNHRKGTGGRNHGMLGEQYRILC